MYHASTPAWQRAVVRVLVFVAMQMCALAHAHVHWTQTNNINSSTVGLYHFDDASTTIAMPALGLPPDLGFTVFSGSTPFMSPVSDTPGSIFAPQGLSLPATQTLRTTSTVGGLDGDLTIEFWFKWAPTLNAAQLEIGLRSGARILLSRDQLNPSNDKFGVAGTHGSFVSAPGFTNWTAMSEDEAALGEWRHLALTVHSTGLHYDTLSGHDVYNAGTVGRLYYNGHAVGSYPFTFDLSGLQVHDASGLTIIMTGAGMTIDEMAVWKYDWSQNGAIANPFANGRGNAAVNDWQMYND